MARGFNYAPGASEEVNEARKPDLHKTHLLALGQSSNRLVRELIAAREDCPLGLMVTLAHDHHPEVRRAVAGNPKALASVMGYLAKDRHTEVVETLISNPALPADILDELAFHKKDAVRKAAARRLDEGLPVAPPVYEDAATPELRDRAVGADGAVVVDFATGEHVASQPPAVPALENSSNDRPDTPEGAAPRPTRTAPVRGFRPQAG